jgi:hypothetical protein
MRPPSAGRYDVRQREVASAPSRARPVRVVRERLAPMRSLDLRGRRSKPAHTKTPTCLRHTMPANSLDRRGLRSALPPFCQNGVSCFATSDWSGFRQKIGNSGFSRAVEG